VALHWLVLPCLIWCYYDHEHDQYLRRSDTITLGAGDAVARNNAIDYMRKKRVPVEEFTICLETAATTFRPEREAERSWLSSEVVEAIDDLPPAYREVVDLRFFHQLCYQEIATVLCIPLGTVKSRLNYAIQRLTKLLHDRGIDHSLVDN
jgi:DNA-directed RNA polymerase specialized sigma24 family protein